MVNLNEIFNSLKWVVFLLAIITTILALVYTTAEAQATAAESIGFTIQSPEIDTPGIGTLLWVLWMMLILSQTSWKMLRVASDRAIMAGLNKPESCIASDLQTKGDLGFLRVGGSKLIPDIDGSGVWAFPLTHVFKIFNTVWIEARGAPDTKLDCIPPDIKEDIYQRRGGLFGIQSCTVGWLSTREMQENTRFKGADLFGKGASEEDKKEWTTLTFLAGLTAMIKAISVQFDYYEDDTSPIERKLASIKRIGAAANQHEKKGILDHILVMGD